MPVLLLPLLFGGGDELVDHDLRAVAEVAELRFPQRQRQRIRHAVAELEAEHGVLAQAAIEHIEARLIAGERCCSGMYFAPVS